MEHTNIELEYIRNFDLNISYYSLTDKEITIAYCLLNMLEYNYTLRKAQQELNVPRSTLHYWIHKYSSGISIELYDLCISLMKKHKSRK